MFDIKVKRELEEKASKIASDIAKDVENDLYTYLDDENESGIVQALIYSQLASWFMCAHFAVTKEMDKDKKEPPLSDMAQDIIDHAVFMFKKCKIVIDMH